MDQNIIIIEEEDKFNKLMEILGHFGEGQSLIFVHTQQKCDTILKDLMHASYSVMSLHGGKHYFRGLEILRFLESPEVLT